MAITDKAMQSRPTDADQWFSDDWGRGDGRFLGRITPKGRSCFYFRYTLPDGKRDSLPIGDYSKDGKGGLTLADARAKALEWSKLYKEGARNLREHFNEQERNALAEKQGLARQAEAEREREANEAEQLAKRLTVKRLFVRWQETDLTPRVNRAGKREGRKDGGEQIEWRFDLHVFPVIGTRPAEELRRSEVMEILDKLSTQGKTRTHNLVLTELRQMYKFAQVREIVNHDPTAGIKRKDEGERKRWLRPEELQTLRDALPTCGLHARTQLAVMVQLSTACRIGELIKAQWSEIDLATKAWHIPAGNAKNGKAHLIHLSPFAVRHFEALAKLSEVDNPWIFPATKGKAHADKRPMLPTSINKQLTDRQRTAESRLAGRTPHTTALALPHGGWSTHDLRRTAATMMSKLHIRIEVIHKCLNHSLEDELAGIYVQDDMLDERKKAFEALGGMLDATLGNKSAGNVVPLHAAA
jgi:integrase